MELVKGEIRSAVPPAVPVAAKTGSLPGVRCEFGVVAVSARPFAMAIFSAYLEGASPVAPAAGILYRYYDALGRANRAGRFLR